MKLWTFQHESFQVDGTDLIDPSKGKYWNLPKMRYKDSLDKILSKFNLSTYPLWCYTTPNEKPASAVDFDGDIEWEIEAPESEIIAVFKEREWDDYLYHKSESFCEVFSMVRPIDPSPWLTVILRFPLSTSCCVMRIGRLVPPDLRNLGDSLTLMGRPRQITRLRELHDDAKDESVSEELRQVAKNRLIYLSRDRNIKTSLDE